MKNHDKLLSNGRVRRQHKVQNELVIAIKRGERENRNLSVQGRQNTRRFDMIKAGKRIP